MPLFPFVWQYNNQPIEVLAADIASLIPSNINTADYIPVSDGTTFIDSPLKAVPLTPTISLLVSEYNGIWDGIKIGPAKYAFGAIGVGAGAGNNTILDVDDIAATVVMKTSYPPGPSGGTYLGVGGGSGAILARGLDTAVPAGVSSGLYLRVQIANTMYKLELLADA